jgi:hypothetical protein
MLTCQAVSFPLIDDRREARGQHHVASPEDIIVMKAIAGRGRDIMDIENIIQANPV